MKTHGIFAIASFFDQTHAYGGDGAPFENRDTHFLGRADKARRHGAPGAIAISFESAETYCLLLRVVHKMTADAYLKKDLVQEALIQLWRLQKQCPGQHPSWYLQSCQFHLQNVLRKGRSIDSWKRRHKQLQVLAPDSDDSDEQSDPTQLLSHANSSEGSFSAVCARDLMASLSKWLEPVDQLILEHLADGLSVREIGAKLNLSHTTVVNRRRKIACFALKLGCLPASNSRTN